jgi:hypothetical protein
VTRSRSGSGRTTYTLVKSDVPCSIQQARGRQTQTPAGAVLRASYTGFFLPGAVIRIGDRVTLDDGQWDATFVNRLRYRGGIHHVEVGLEKAEALAEGET